MKDTFSLPLDGQAYRKLTALVEAAVRGMDGDAAVVADPRDHPDLFKEGRESLSLYAWALPHVTSALHQVRLESSARGYTIGVQADPRSRRHLIEVIRSAPGEPGAFELATEEDCGGNSVRRHMTWLDDVRALDRQRGAATGAGGGVPPDADVDADTDAERDWLSVQALPAAEAFALDLRSVGRSVDVCDDGSSVSVEVTEPDAPPRPTFHATISVRTSFDGLVGEIVANDARVLVVSPHLRDLKREVVQEKLERAYVQSLRRRASCPEAR